MALKRRRPVPTHYPCPVAESMAMLAGAWTPHILWHLSEGPRRFSELRASLPGLSAKVLTTRLRELEDRFMVTRQVKPTSPPSVDYELTDLGFDMLPVLKALASVGERIRERQAI